MRKLSLERRRSKLLTRRLPRLLRRIAAVGFTAHVGMHYKGRQPVGKASPARFDRGYYIFCTLFFWLAFVFAALLFVFGATFNRFFTLLTPFTALAIDSAFAFCAALATVPLSVTTP